MSVSENDPGHNTLFVISNFLLPPSRSMIIRQLLFGDGFASPWNNRKTCLFSVGAVSDLHQHAASASWRLSSGRWNVTAWHFVQQSCSSIWFSQGYCPEAAETLSCLIHCMWLSTFSSSACNVKGTRCLDQGQTRAQPLPNCLCDILKKILGYV